MRHLLLLRHAKAVAGERGTSDRDRPLAERGIRDAGLMGRAMAEEPLPDLILCSPAVRTRQTLAELVRAWPSEPEVDYPDDLYGQTAPTYADAIARHGRDAERLLVVGHNPTIHMTALALAEKPGGKLTAKMPTGALVAIDFDVRSWANLRAGSGSLVGFRRPRDVGATDADD